MSDSKIREIQVFKKEYVLKSSRQDHIEEHEYLVTRTRFNEHGKTLSELHFDSTGKVVQEYCFAYDPQGRLTEEKLLEEDGFEAEHKSWEYDDSGKIAREYRHYADGSRDTIEFQYDNEDQVIRKVTLDPDGETESVEEFAYENGLVVRHVIFDQDGEILSEKKTIWDDKGNALETFDYDGTEETSVRSETEYYPSGTRKQTLTYNEDNELIEKVVFHENEEGKLTEMSEESAHRKNTVHFGYDTEGNIVLQEEHDRHGKLISKVSREFGPDNQLLASDVFIDGAGRGVSRRYILRQEYLYFGKD
jgi:antitoxin component YwqK of YwqJK toxin-antitoxin module